MAHERVLETFQIDLQQEALEMVVGSQDVFVIRPKGSGKSLIFQSASTVLCKSNANDNR